MKKPKVVLVQCPVWSVYFPSIGLGYLVAYLKKIGYDVNLFDFNVDYYHSLSSESREKIYSNNFPHDEFKKMTMEIIEKNKEKWVFDILETKSKVITFSVQYPSLDISLSIAKEIKNKAKDTTILFGGSSCSPIGTRENQELHDALDKGIIDGLVIGEGELTIEKVLADLSKNKKIKKIPGLIIKSDNYDLKEYKSNPIKNLDELPFPDYSDFDIKKYIFNDKCLILFGRGCPSSCVFCSEKHMWGKYRFRSAQNVFNEVKLRVNQGFRSFYFTDELINGNIFELSKFCNMVIKENLKISWGGNFKVDKRLDKKYFTMMRKAGCEWLQFGIESGSSKVLKLMKKGYNPKEASRNLRDARRSGIHCRINIIVGFPGEGKKEFIETLLFILANKKFFEIGKLEICDVYPGTELYINHSEFEVMLYKENGQYWSTKNQKNTYYERLMKKKIFNIFTKLFFIKNDAYSNININDFAVPIAESFYYLKRFDEAKKFIDIQLKKYPDDNDARYWKEKVEKNG